MGLNESLYKRFWLELDRKKIRRWFTIKFKNTFSNSEIWLYAIIRPDFYEDKIELQKIQTRVIKEICEQLFIDFTKTSGLKNLIENIFYYLDDYSDPDEYFFELMTKCQIILNIIYKEKFISVEYNNFVNEIEKYINAYPELWIFMKMYKTKAPQIYPLNCSKIIEKNIDNVLWILEERKYKNTLIIFEDWLRKLLSAKIYKDFKDIFTDMAWSLDEFVKEFSWDNNKSFKHIFKEWEYQKFGLTKTNKEVYNQIRIYIDDVKHWKIKDIVRKDAEFIINQTAMFINYVLK